MSRGLTVQPGGVERPAAPGHRGPLARASEALPGADPGRRDRGTLALGTGEGVWAAPRAGEEGPHPGQCVSGGRQTAVFVHPVPGGVGKTQVAPALPRVWVTPDVPM